ncbi:MAG: sigma-70 family RNA polymerase sigma factor [Deltaproteobacteria bacterium]|nr:MAG: sigma-70 family RNA polymerase sigma factor [Deltaproteobacteria bacterium]
MAMKVPKEPKLREIIVRLREKAKRKVPLTDAEDIVQEVLVVLVERMQRPQPIESLQAYADGVLRHVIYDYYQRKRETLLPNEQGMEQVSPTPTPEQRVVWMRHLRVIESLAEENRIDESLVNEHFVGGAPLREVADHLNVSPGAVNGRLFRFRQKVMKVAGSCFAGLLALGTSLWSRASQAANLSRGKLALAGSGLLSLGVFVTWLAVGTTPSSSSGSSLARSFSATPSTTALPFQAPQSTLQSSSADKAKMAVLLQPSTTQAPLKDANSQEQSSQPAHKESKVRRAIKQALSEISTKVPFHVPFQVIAPTPKSTGGVQQPSVNKGTQTSLTAPSLKVAAAATAPTQPTLNARRQAVTTSGILAASAIAALPTAPVARPSQQPNVATPSVIQTAGTNGLNRTPTSLTPTVKPAVPPTTPTVNRPNALDPSQTLAMAPSTVVRPVGINTSAPQLPQASNSKANVITQSLRHSFCVIQDSRVYRCDSGRMEDVTGPHNEAFGCKSELCKNVVGKGPSLVVTQKFELFIVGPTSYMKSNDQGETWATPSKILSSDELLKQSHLILNQNGELWQQINKTWEKKRDSQSSLHEVRLHLDRAAVSVEDDGGFKLQWDGTKNSSTEKKSIQTILTDQLSTKVKTQVQPHLPSLKKTQKEDIPAPPQENVTPIGLEP